MVRIPEILPPKLHPIFQTLLLFFFLVGEPSFSAFAPTWPPNSNFLQNPRHTPAGSLSFLLFGSSHQITIFFSWSLLLLDRTSIYVPPWRPASAFSFSSHGLSVYTVSFPNFDILPPISLLNPKFFLRRLLIAVDPLSLSLKQ